MTGRFTRHLGAIVALTGLSACAHAKRTNSLPGDSLDAAGLPDSLIHVRQISSDDLVAAWMLRSEPPQRATGLRITFTVDSATGTRFYGELSHFFSGNVGTDPSEFEPFVGSFQAGRIAFAVARRTRPNAGVSLIGHLGTDTVFCDTLIIGPDTLTGRGRLWFLIRESHRTRDSADELQAAFCGGPQRQIRSGNIQQRERVGVPVADIRHRDAAHRASS